MKIHFSPGPAHNCLQCGASCYHSAIGPISDAEIERVEASSIREAMPHLPEPFWYEVSDANSDRRYRFFKTERAHCVFLTEDGRCGIHRHIGLSAKPLVCRTFPFVLTQTPTGLYAQNTIECRVAREALTRSHEEAAEEIAGIWSDGPPAHYVIGDTVHLTLERSVSYGEYEVLEDELMAIIAQRELDYEERLRRIASRVAAAGAIDGEPLDDEAYRAVIRGFSLALATLARRCAGLDKEPLFSSRWLQLSEAAHSMVNWINIPRLVLEPEAVELLERHLENLLYGKMLIAKSVLADGVALARCQQFIVKGLAAYRAAQGYRHRVSGRDLNDAVLIVEFVGRTTPMVEFWNEHIETIRLLFLDAKPRRDSR
ncbi:MAG: YkgJ family cysteine cluster protein [Myxococcales bacterium]|nr:YkgJ family cysteine cluster protein [Myxococcales bacterium]